MVSAPIVQKNQLVPPHEPIQSVQLPSCSAPRTSVPPVGTSCDCTDVCVAALLSSPLSLPHAAPSRANIRAAETGHLRVPTDRTGPPRDSRLFPIGPLLDHLSMTSRTFLRHRTRA